MGAVTLAVSSYDRVEYRLLQQHQSDSEGEETTRRIPLRRVRARADKMNLSVFNRPLFQTASLTVSLIGLSLVITTLAWVGQFKGGVSFTTTEKGIDFNWHPILMTISLIFLYGNGALIYRVIPARNESHKLKLKLGHAGAMLLAFILMVIGLKAAFDSHNYALDKDNKPAPKPNMYTLHSWVGLLAFLFPKFSGDIRALLLPFHQYFGSSILVLAAAAALMGHLEKAIWSNKEYSLKNAEAVLVNVTGLLIVLFVMGVNFLLSTVKKDLPDKKDVDLNI